MSEQKVVLPVRGIEDLFVTGENLLGGKLHLLEFDKLLQFLTEQPSVQVRFFCDQPYRHYSVITKLSNPDGARGGVFVSDQSPRLSVTKTDRIFADFIDSTYMADVQKLGENNFKVDIMMGLLYFEIRKKLQKVLGKVPANWQFGAGEDI